jgi:hypothetical protein
VWGNREDGMAVDPYFRLPLWLQARCCTNRTLWAYNLQHLEFLERFVAAGLRERAHQPAAGEYHRRMTMVAKLPVWMKSAKNRAEIVKALGRLKATVPA